MDGINPQKTRLIPLSVSLPPFLLRVKQLLLVKVTMAAAAADGAERKPLVKVTKWNAVGVWSWNVKVENCAICRNAINDLCIECTANAGGESTECQIAWGVCNHAYHHHCITRWLKTRATCPMDDREWEMTSLESSK